VEGVVFLEEEKEEQGKRRVWF